MKTAMVSTSVEEGELAPIVAAYTEVTERLKRSHETLAREVCRLREELHEKNKELQRRERLAALGEMAAGVAHEIRNPLGGIGLYASLLERDLAAMPPQLEIVKKLSSGVTNLERIVGDILTFAVDAAPNRCRVRLRSILDDVLEQVRPESDARLINLTADPSLSTEDLYCDPAQIGRALINLLMNAFEAAGENGRVHIHTDGRDAFGTESAGRRVSDRMCRVVIEDSGSGLTPESERRIFDPFFTTKSSGTGLGLAIVHRIAQANGGSVLARNGRGGGAVFVLSIPRADASGSERLARAS